MRKIINKVGFINWMIILYVGLSVFNFILPWLLHTNGRVDWLNYLSSGFGLSSAFNFWLNNKNFKIQSKLRDIKNELLEHQDSIINQLMKDNLELREKLLKSMKSENN